jgi:ribosomal protein S18 acetylase RimI-like enzyme
MASTQLARIRLLEAADDRTLEQLVAISMAGNDYAPDDREHYEEAWLHFEREFAAFDTEGEVFPVAEVADRIVGFARLRRSHGTQETWWVLGLEVCEPCRRRGIGTALLAFGLDEVRSRGAARVLSTLSKRNTASLGLHSKLGFRVVSDQFETFDGRPVGHRRSWLLEHVCCEE